MALPTALRHMVANAQVVVNQAALQQLAGIAPPPPPAPMPPIKRRLAARLQHLPPHPIPAVAKTALPPVVPVLARPVPPPMLPPPAHAGPVSINFAPGSAVLPVGAAATLKPLCTASGFVSVDATAQGDPADPSVAMRLSLSRAFAVRDALAACGVPAAHILPRALGDLKGKDENSARVSEAK